MKSVSIRKKYDFFVFPAIDNAIWPIYSVIGFTQFVGHSLEQPGDLVIFIDKFQHSTLFSGNVACCRDRGTELK